jgi:ATP-binding cassette subfamily B protein
VEEIFQNNPNIVDSADSKFLKRKVKGLLEAKNLKYTMMPIGIQR